MGIVIGFATNEEKKKMELFEELKNSLKKGEKNITDISSIYEIIKEIRDESKLYSGAFAVPIFKIADCLGIASYSSDINDGAGGYIFAGGTTKKHYNNNNVVILVDQKSPLEHQRFVAAHEIAHYLFDYLPNEKYQDGKLLFKEAYHNDNQDSFEEKRADLFAAELLMPAELFLKEFCETMKNTQNRTLTVMYLAKYFKVKTSTIEKRIKEVIA